VLNPGQARTIMNDHAPPARAATSSSTPRSSGPGTW
jgi:hypothetical protein